MVTMMEDSLMISGIQHFAFCPRQWALIHIEQQWKDNLRTVDGQIFHKGAHHGEPEEKRGNVLITRGLRVQSVRLGIHGICDVVEFHLVDEGFALANHKGLWKAYPVEYKKGNTKDENTDPYLKEKIPWGLVPYVQSLLLSRFLRGDLEEYPPFLWK